MANSLCFIDGFLSFNAVSVVLVNKARKAGKVVISITSYQQNKINLMDAAWRVETQTSHTVKSLTIISNPVESSATPSMEFKYQQITMWRVQLQTSHS